MDNDFEEKQFSLLCCMPIILIYSVIGPNLNIGLDTIVLFEAQTIYNGNVSTFTTGNMLLVKTCYGDTYNCTKIYNFPSPMGSVMALNFGAYITVFTYMALVRPITDTILTLLHNETRLISFSFGALLLGSVMVLIGNGLFITSVLPKMGFTTVDLTATTYVQLVLECLTVLMTLYVFFDIELLIILNRIRCSRRKTHSATREIDLELTPCKACGQRLAGKIVTLMEVKHTTSRLARFWKSHNYSYIDEMNDNSLNDPVTLRIVETMIHTMWEGNKVGLGRDARGLTHSKLQIVYARHLLERNVLHRYKEGQLRLLNDAVDRGERFRPPEDYGPGVTKVATQDFIANTRLEQKVDPRVNEFYLFHGTNFANLEKIELDGLRPGRGGMLGAGIYLTDHPVKADQYTGHDEDPERLCCLLLCRVLLGNIAMLTSDPVTYPCKARTPPCKLCHQPNTKHELDSNVYYDSLVFNGLLFREFVVYDSSYVLPEFAVIYRRVNDSSHTSM